MNNILEKIKDVFTPFKRIDKKTKIIIYLIQTIFILTILQFSSSHIIPKPSDVAASLTEILQTQSFYGDLAVSFILTAKSMGVAIIIALIFSYLYPIPFFEGISKFVTFLRYLTISSLSFMFLVLFPDSSDYKMSLMLFGIVPFFVTSLLASFANIDKQELELAKTLKMSNWQAWYEIIIVGGLDQVVLTISVNFAIGWGMISYVESQMMSEGGIGTLMAKNMKFFHLSLVFAILIIILSFGTLSDFILSYIRKLLFPYTKIQKI